MRLGSYQVVREIGRGAMGRVSVAVHVPTGVERALKVLDLAPSPDAIARFRREAEVLARAAGRGVVRIHEVGLDGRTFWYAMDLMPGGSLAARLRARGPLPWREACTLVSGLAAALGRCHAAGVVHRDVKPENVLFDAQDAPCLADFGCARDARAERLTETGALVGTPSYMSPEQILGVTVGPPADVFALGVVLHELVSGERPFAETSLTDLLLAITRGDRVPFRAPADAPPGLARLLDRMLATEASERPRDGAELARALDALLSGTKAPLAAASAPRRLVAPLVVAALLVAGGALAVLAARSRGGPPVPLDAARPRASTPPAPPSPLFAPPPVTDMERSRTQHLVAAAVRDADLNVAHSGTLEEMIATASRSLDAIAAARSAGVVVSASDTRKVFSHVHSLLVSVALSSRVEGIDPFLRILELDPERTLDLRLEAIIYLAQHLETPGVAPRLEVESRAVAEDETATPEERSTGYGRLSRALRALDRMPESIAAIESGLALDPDSGSLIVSKTNVFIMKGEIDEAFAWSAANLDRTTGDEFTALLEIRVGLFLNRGDPEGALHELERLRKDAPVRVHTLAFKAEALFRLGRRDAGVAALRQAHRTAMETGNDAEQRFAELMAATWNVSLQ